MNGKFSLGVIAGIAFGAVVGILLAPEKGSLTRKKLSKKGEDYAEDLKEKFNDFLESVMEKHDSVKKEAGEIVVEKSGVKEAADKK